SLLLTDDLATFKHRLHNALSNNAKRYEIFIDPTITSPDLFLETLVHELFTRFGRVALLVDEYDSPILKTLDNEPLAKSIRDALQQFFTIIKGLDAQIQFVFITGVSSFAKAGLFSGINNVQILSIKEEYAA